MAQSWFVKLFNGHPKNMLEKVQNRAEEDGDAQAQFDLALTFTNGRGEAPDYERAAQCYLKAANQDHAVAQFALGNMFADGCGVPRDEVKALMWIGKAAQQGYAEAQHSLGLWCCRAIFKGLPADAKESAIEAYKWFRLASVQGCKGSEAEFQCLAMRMTREQVLEGNRRATTFVAAG
jgi:TPR repeat protein